MTQRNRIGLVATAGALWALAHAGATTIPPLTAGQLTRQAELIFAGEVVDIEHRLSQTGPDRVALPHTFVTFRIERVFKGAADSGNLITLRLQGGPVPGSDTALAIEGIPTFDLGDRDVLFVAGNGRRICPLAGWSQGRLRILEGAVYSEGGHEIWLTGEGGLAYGPAHPFPEVLTHQLGAVLMARESAGRGPEWTAPPGARRATTAEFSRTLEEWVAAAHTPSELAALEPQPSARPDEPFDVRAPRAAAAPTERAGGGPALQGEADPVEERLLAERARAEDR